MQLPSGITPISIEANNLKEGSKGFLSLKRLKSLPGHRTGFCGIGMDATLGDGLNLLVTDRYAGPKANFLTILLSFLIMGVTCDLLCLNLDLHFNYFGA